MLDRGQVNLAAAGLGAKREQRARRAGRAGQGLVAGRTPELKMTEFAVDLARGGG